MLTKLRVKIQPYVKSIHNWLDYHLYSLFHNPFPYFTKLFILLSLLWSLYSLHTSSNYFFLLIPATAFFVFEIYNFIHDIKTGIEEKQVFQLHDDAYYDNVEMSNREWQKHVVYTIKDTSIISKNTMFFSQTINEWLMDNEKQYDVTIKENKNYSKALRKKLSGENFRKLYHHFLRFNYRYSQFYGKQFTNEQKWGICSELSPDSTHVSVHKTGYFDSYLTNIALGKKLLSTRNTNKCVASLTGESNEPVDSDTYNPFYVTEKNKILKSTGDTPMANEPGVTTFGILSNGKIPLWIQSNQAQSNPGQIVVAGSGSGDWKDCAPFLNKADGLRQSVINGMERELYEESIGNRMITEKDFKKYTKTMVTGYFRWLEKAGKSEFVGFSCIDTKHKGIELVPEQSEVCLYNENKMYAETVENLRQILEELVHPAGENECKQYGITMTDHNNGVLISHCNLSSTAAIFFLEKLIDSECEKDANIASKPAYQWLSEMAEKHELNT